MLQILEKCPFFGMYSYIYSMNRCFYIHRTHILYSHALPERTNQTKTSVIQGKKCRKCAISRTGRTQPFKHTFIPLSDGYPDASKLINVIYTIFDYLVDGFYNLSYNDELHPKEGAEDWKSYIFLPGMAADYPTDVTAEVKAAHPDWIPESATAGYAWEIPLREDLYFDSGYHITADTYVQSMKYMLDQRLQNYRATDVYNGT